MRISKEIYFINKPEIFSQIRKIFENFTYRIKDNTCGITFILSPDDINECSYLEYFIKEINNSNNITSELLKLNFNMIIELYDPIINQSEIVTLKSLQSLISQDCTLYNYYIKQLFRNS